MVRALVSKLALRFPWMVCLLPTSNPVQTQCYRCPGPDTARTLIVFLPGISDLGKDYARYGFIDAVQQKSWSADLVVVDAHYGYYAKRSILDRLHEDVFEPAKMLGYQNRWLVGISLGGFGALLYTSRHDTDVTGVVAIAPYLGRPELVAEIAAAGGIRNWSPDALGEHDYERHVWAWLKRYGRPDTHWPALCLAYGNRDTFVEAHRVLGAVLPPKQVFIESGAHDWTTWQKLWQTILASNVFAKLDRRL
ncbi:MAG TPA: alpha/beta fold hydrolase [Nitrospiraceae bacterium]|nr:alpha/beta fold hydrolase [Nitrospiraceae bacterium]